jgi:FkbM family methyltransferase
VQRKASANLWSSPIGHVWVPAYTSKATLAVAIVLLEDFYPREPCGIRSGDVVLDIGAHVGMYARQAIAAGAKLVVAVEPDPVNVECIRRNLAVEIAAGRVIVVPLGIWKTSTTLTLNRDRECSTRHSIVLPAPASGDHLPVAVTTVDRVVADKRLEKVSYIKIHVEGAEKEVLLGASDTIRRFQPVIAVPTYHLADDVRRLPEIARSASPSYATYFTPCIYEYSRFRPQLLLMCPQQTTTPSAATGSGRWNLGRF